MADEITPSDSNEITDTQFILTTDNVQGDPPGTTGTLTGPINVALQKIVNTLLYLKNRVGQPEPDRAQREHDGTRNHRNSDERRSA